jgi:carbamoyl-phosphate synthase small subunit
VSAQDKRYDGPAVLVFEDGRAFHGQAFGAKATRVGEVVFNTAMAGYQEIVSDASYTGQLVCLTAPEIGVVGTNADDEESFRHGADALIIRTLSPAVSNWRSEASLSDYLRRRGLPGIAEVDTRAITRHLRNAGALRGVVSTEQTDVDALVALAREAPPMEGRNLAAEVTTKDKYVWDEGSWATRSAPATDLHVVAYDYGIKHNILRMLRDRGVRTTVVPAETPVEEVIRMDPDGVILSNGPGDPAAVEGAQDRIAGLVEQLEDRPLFGICLGHQLLCLALGGATYKLKFGHHGGNHPVRDERDARVAITSQNHGFAVDMDSLGEGGVLTHLNLFDQTVAGLAMRDKPIFSVQYHPEASPGPHDAGGLFDTFVDDMRTRAAARRAQ